MDKNETIARLVVRLHELEDTVAAGDVLVAVLQITIDGLNEELKGSKEC